MYINILHEHFIFSIAWIDLGYIASAFVTAVTRKAPFKQIHNSFLAIPKINLYFKNSEIMASQLNKKFYFNNHQIYVRSPQISANVHIELNPAIEILKVRGTSVTHQSVETNKSVLLSATGEINFSNQHFKFQNTLAGMDHTWGVLPRHTEWKWCWGFGNVGNTPTAFNFADGNNLYGVSENALWHPTLQPQSPVRFEIHAKDEWRIFNDKGVDLFFRPLSVHTENKNLLFLKSRFHHYLGEFSGALPHHGHTIQIHFPGVLEDQSVLW